MEKVKLQDVASFSKGQQINGDELIENGQYEYLNGGINPSGHWKEFNVNGNTVTISEGGNSCGYINYMKFPFWCGAHCYYLYNLKIDSKYLYYALKSQQEKIMKLRSGACMPNIKKSDLGNFELIISTDVNIQNQTVLILENISELINKRKEQLSKLDELVKARFVEMFGDPVRNPMQWDTYPLEECLERIDNGKSFICSDKPRTDNNPAILKLSAATYGDYRPHENKALLDESLFVESAEVHAGDLLFTRKNTPELVGMAAYVQNTPSKLMMPDLIFRLVPNEKVNAVFLWQLINCKEFRPVIQAISGGSAKSMSNISKERLGKIKVICPPRELQDSLIPFVKQLDKSKLKVQNSLEKLELLKKALMQKYFG